jgi:MFS transporter, DHA1 family, multidrug resistance protein
MTQAYTAAQLDPAVPSVAPHAGIGFREFVTGVAAMMALVALAIDTMLPALPAIGSSLGVADENRRQLIVTVFLIGLGTGQILYGPISDRVGRRPVLIGGAAAYSLFSAGVALTPGFGAMLALRLLQGVAVAATRVVTISMVRDCYGGRQMARVMSLAFLVFFTVPVLAPSVGQVILTFTSWRGLFWILTAWGAMVVAWLVLRVPETLHPEYRRAVDLRSIASAMGRALRDRQAAGYMLAQTVLAGALYGYINSVEQIFADVFHRPRAMPIGFASVAGMMAVASLINSRIVERLGTRRVSHSAMLGFVAIELAHLGVVLAGLETVWTFSAFQGLAMFCFGLCGSNFGAMAMEPLAAIAGTAASVQGFVTTVLGALLGFAIGQSFDGTTLPTALGFAVAGVVALLLVLATERGRLFRPQHGA